MKNYDENEESSFLEYLDVNNLYGWAMSEPLPVDGFNWMEDLSKTDEDFIKNSDKNSGKGYILEVDVEYPKNLHDLHSDLPFLPERMKIDKCNKLVCNLYDKKDYVVHIRSLKQALNHELILKKVHRIIQFNQKAWLKAYIDMNTELRKQAKNDFEKDFFKLMKMLFLFWYDYMKPKCNDNAKLRYMDTDSFIMHIKTEDFYKDIADDVEKRFDTSNYGFNRPLPIGKNKKVIGLMTEFVSLRPKTYSYLMDDGWSDKKAKGTKKCVIKRRLKFNDYKDCLLNNEIVLKSQEKFKSERHDVYTEEINKIALSSNDDKRLQTYDRITSYHYGTSAGKVCKTELLSKVNIK